jgi:L-threonylcarbamoyladenylate synthase
MIQDIQASLEALRSGGMIVYPTDTIWGIGCDATNPEAVQKIYQLKQREETRSMLVLLHSPGQLAGYVDAVPDIAWQLIEVADKPLTLIYPGAKNLAHNLIGSDGTIGIRMVRDDFCIRLLQAFRKPLVSTSANLSGTPSPGCFQDIPDAILSGADYVVRWRQDDTTPGQPSSIIKIGHGGTFSILRP